MKRKEIKVTFQPMGRSVYVLPGTIILEAAGRAGMILQAPCGGRGTCGKCRVKVISGSSSTDKNNHDVLTEELFNQGYRLACQTRVEGPLVAEIPEESLFENQYRVLVDDIGHKGEVNPAIRKKYFELSVPTQKDALSDIARLRSAIGNVTVSIDILQRLPSFIRKNNWHGTAVLVEKNILTLEKGDTTESMYGVAFDIGTTTIVGTLVDLVKGKEVAVASELNPQIAYGDDVISRILRVRENSGALSELRGAVVSAVNSILMSLTQQAGVLKNRIYEIAIAGNATMQQIFCGIDPSALGELPFVQVFDRGHTFSAMRTGLAVNPNAQVYIFPQIGGFVGGDTVASMVAARIDQSEKPVLLIDIGTNGEIVLSNEGKLIATSTAAGPAFEGARIVQGMRAAAGAVEKVVISDDVYLNVIGNSRPVGICGSALIDAAAEMLRAGVLDETGRVLSREELASDVSEKLRERLVKTDGEVNFMLADASITVSGDPLYIWQKDIRELQLAIGAIRAGINILLRRAGLKPEELGVVLLAGAFGNFIRRSNARRIGLLPQIPRNRILFIGNAASLGAKMALKSVNERKYADDLRNKTEHVDLSLDPEFQTEFGMAMMFPDADSGLCEDEG